MNQKRFEPDPDSLMMAEFFDDQPHPIVWLRPLLAADGVTINDFRYTYCNSEGLRFLNLTPGDQHDLFLSTTPTLSDNLRKEILEEMIRIIKTGEKSETTFFNPPLNKYVRVVRSRLRGGILTVVKDLTPEDSVLRRMEEQTREIQAQKNLLDNILKHSSNGITVGEMIRNGEGAIVDIKALLANDAACRFTGFSKERYLTKTGGELDPAFVGSPYFQLCVRCMETGEPFITQYYLDSLHVWLEVSVSKMDEEHQIYIFTDVTPVKEAQLATERSAAQLETIINRTQSGVLAISPVTNEKGEIIDFRFVLANKAVAAYVQQDPAVLIGDVGSQWFTSYKSNGLFDLFCDTYNHHKENRFDFHYNTDGIDAWIDMMCTRFDNDVLITFTDYTPIKKLQLELQKTVEELRQSNAGLE
ncbi:MAG: PAS domain-containing protein, partial [Bacteroidota bacterium]|nr:PAS domain-containing protein [Bacteroidota bacterium]